MFGIMCEDGNIITADNLEAVLASKEALVDEGKQCTQVQCKSTLEALLAHLKGE
jgi:hypothetical protein